MTKLLSLYVKGYTSRKFLIVFSIVVSALIVDISLSNISDLISVSTSWGIAAFTSVAVVYALGQYLILQFVKQKSKTIRMKPPHFNKLSTIITITQYVLTGTIVLVILQTFLNSYYYTSLLIWDSSISYSIASFLTMILTLKFFSWYRSNRNLIVLSYGISSAIISISIVSALVFFTATLLAMPAKISPQSGLTLEHKEVGHGPDIRRFDQSTMSGKVQTVFAISHVLSFLSLWASTVLLLRTYSQKLGKVKFWIIISIPLASFASIFIIITPFVSYAADTTIKIMVDALGYTMPAISSSILFGLPFWMIARTLDYGSILKDYLIIASSGLVLFELASTGNVILGSYPPLGFASVSFVGLSSYLLLMGIYSLAVSISQDIKLRQTIRKSAIEESKLLDSIGSADMELQIQKKVMTVTKDLLENTIDKSGIQPSITEDDMKQYLGQVLSEVKKQKTSTRKQQESQG
jgi:hypothetical protein